MVDARFCPYCERWLDEGPLRRLMTSWRRPRTGVATRTIVGVSERALLTAGLVVFGLVAATCIVAAVLVV
jgi:hypothetical protein